MAMRVWLYTRLSNDDDPAQNSLQNQQEICRAFAEKKVWSIAGSSADDNISGMNFSRRGLDMLTAAVQAKQVDAVLVKDLSRLGRHRTQTALFIDYLRQQQVRVISVTEGVDTFCEEDDLMIGVRGLMNDYYAKDIGKKIRAGYRQKQKDGLVITPPFGYWKDRNTNQVVVHQDAAETVQLIYALYLQGCGQKEIARRLNRLGRKTPAQIMTERLGYDSQKPHKTRDGQFLWTYASVKNILVEEAYTGVLVNHRREYCGGKARAVNEADWLRHENFYPVIIEKADWKQVQALLKQQARPAVNNRTKHRYAGLLTCRDCGDGFIPMIRYWNGSQRVEYVCRGYHRNGKTYCASHRIHEERLDEQVWELVSASRDSRAEELKKLAQMQKMWALRKPVLDAHILSLQKRIQELEQEIDEIVMEKLIKSENTIKAPLAR
jgi:site-specific DNA recombinase